MKKGEVIGIDISSKVIKVAKQKYKIKNVKVKDIFNFKTSKRFDTIILLESNLGMAGSLTKTKRLLKILSNLLNEKGQILTNGTNISKDYYEAELIPVWKNQRGQKFKWINFNPNKLEELCKESNLKLEILNKNKSEYLAKITRW